MKVIPLADRHHSLGAAFDVREEWNVPLHYGDPVAEHLAVRSGVGLADLSGRGLACVTGEDRLTWLQSIISNDLRPVQPGHGLYSAFMNHKGKILSYFRVYVLDEEVWLEDVRDVGETTYPALRKFLLFGTKAKLASLTEQWGVLLIAGPRAPQVARAAFEIEVETFDLLEIRQIDVDGSRVLVALTEETGEIDVEVFAPAEGLSRIWDRLWEAGRSEQIRAVGRLALDSLRIEAGLPKGGAELTEAIVPPEANLEGKAFSLTKGCYPGQEVVARMDTYGSVKRRLVGLVVHGPEGQLPEPGAKLFNDGREIGWVSSAAYSPVLKQVVALGFPLRDFTRPDTPLLVDLHGNRVPAVVHPLPFYSRSQKSN
ncbi:MAG: aminomethyl transferase family protein [Nitrospirae bacterium]|nr:MAG: aminomethyl transferase family protein [Nitrospirota bacterium]